MSFFFFLNSKIEKDISGVLQKEQISEELMNEAMLLIFNEK